MSINTTPRRPSQRILLTWDFIEHLQFKNPGLFDIVFNNYKNQTNEFGVEVYALSTEHEEQLAEELDEFFTSTGIKRYNNLAYEL